MSAQQGGWFIVSLLFFFMVINFLDKTVIGLSGVPIMKELHLSHVEFGEIMGSFFYLFSISSVVVGFIANRIQTRWVILAMALVWAIAQFPLFWMVGPGTLIASRIMLGAGEGPAYPVAVHATHKWFADHRRALPAAILSQGANIGVIVLLPVLNWMLIQYSWHVACGILGIAAALWAVVWLVAGCDGTLDERGSPQSMGWRVSYRRLLINRTILGTWAGGFGAYWCLSLMFSWYTPYLIQGLGYTQAQAGFLTTLPWALAIISNLCGAMLSERLLLRGVSSRQARGILAGGFVVAGGVALILVHIAPQSLKLPLLMAGFALPGLIHPLSAVIDGEISPPSQRAAVLTIGSAVATLAGLLAPAVTGFFIDNQKLASLGYEQGFLVNGVIALVGGVVTMVLVHPEKTKATLYARSDAAILPDRSQP